MVQQFQIVRKNTSTYAAILLTFLPDARVWTEARLWLCQIFTLVCSFNFWSFLLSHLHWCHGHVFRSQFAHNYLYQSLVEDPPLLQDDTLTLPGTPPPSPPAAPCQWAWSHAPPPWPAAWGFMIRCWTFGLSILILPEGGPVVGGSLPALAGHSRTVAFFLSSTHQTPWPQHCQEQQCRSAQCPPHFSFNHNT